MSLLRHVLDTVLFVIIVVLGVGFLFNGLGVSRIYGYWDEYHGGLSWPQYRVVFRPVAPGAGPQHPADALGGGPDPLHLTFTTLRYGFSLENHAPLRRADVLQSELPLADLTPVLFDTTRFGPFSPDSVYYAWVGLRGNYFSFPFGARPAFVLTSCSAEAAPAPLVPGVGVQPRWALPWRLYAWAALLLEPLFLLAATAVLVLPEYRRAPDRLVALLLVLLFVAAAAYVDGRDYQTSGEWPVFKALLSLGLLAGGAYQLRAAPPTEEKQAPEEAETRQP